MRRLLWICLPLACTSTAVAAPTAWELNSNLTIDAVNVANNNEVLYNNTIFPSDSLARDASGNLYSASPAGNLFDVTGPPIPVAPLGRTQIGDLGYANGGLWGFSNANQELFFFDLTSLTVTYSVLLPALINETVTGVAPQASTGDVYLSGHTGLNTDKLIKVPASSNTPSLVGPMVIGDMFSYLADIEFDSTGTLYGMTFYHREFYTISTLTGATTLVSVGPHRDTTAMALTPAAVPEPGTWAALALGFGAFLRRRRN